ncbi:MAG: hypothetical protein P1V35_09290 [Planctomycetota bacterium]|nr:hypothetical protein [Planctomycetota bacterium]
MKDATDKIHLTAVMRDAAEWIRLNKAFWDNHYAERRNPELRNSRKHRESEERVLAGLRSLGAKLWSSLDSSFAREMPTAPYKLEFAIAFIDFDPYYFGSGYTKALLLRKLKSCPLTESQRSRLNAILLDAAANRPWREYSDYCRLAAKIANKKLYEALEQMAKETGAAPARARMMLEKIQAPNP